MNKINTIDLFAGCGGLMEGFEMSGHYKTLACVEWEKSPCDNLKKHLKEKWKYKDADKRVLHFDIQRYEELFEGWKDEKYGVSEGLDTLIGDSSVELIIGGPPCQAYSIAGRVRDENSMRDDYRNYLFESYIQVVKHYNPKAFIFENVPGMLSAKPKDKLIIDVIREAFDKAGYVVLTDLSNAIIDFSDFGVPQNRKRVIILGLSKAIYKEKAMSLLNEFYNVILPTYKTKNKKNVKDAIGNLPELFPLDEEIRWNGKRYSHSFNKEGIKNHLPRWQNNRDIKIFKMLAADILSETNAFISAESLRALYTKITGKTSNVHKYHVLRWNEQSNLIPAHLYKDGLRHIHPDPNQARSITVREAARLQGFPDDYEFIDSQADQFKMIGNAVPPSFSKILAQAIYELLFKEVE